MEGSGTGRGAHRGGTWSGTLQLERSLPARQRRKSRSPDGCSSSRMRRVVDQNQLMMRRAASHPREREFTRRVLSPHPASMGAHRSSRPQMDMRTKCSPCLLHQRHLQHQRGAGAEARQATADIEGHEVPPSSDLQAALQHDLACSVEGAAAVGADKAEEFADAEAQSTVPPSSTTQAPGKAKPLPQADAPVCSPKTQAPEATPACHRSPGRGTTPPLRTAQRRAARRASCSCSPPWARRARWALARQRQGMPHSM